MLIIFLLPGLQDQGLKAQVKADIGVTLAVPWYLGDFSYTLPQPSVSPPAFGLMLRHNLNMRSSLKAHVSYFGLSGSGSILGNTEPMEFTANFVDLGLDFEFNWRPYKTGLTRTPWTPYVTAGLGYAAVVSGSGTAGEPRPHVYMPVGAGVKFNVMPRLAAGVELSMRKSFSDGVDGYWNRGDELAGSVVGNNDWYMFTGVFVTYKFWDHMGDCPTYNEATYSGRSSRKSKPSDQ